MTCLAPQPFCVPQATETGDRPGFILMECCSLAQGHGLWSGVLPAGTGSSFPFSSCEARGPAQIPQGGGQSARARTVLRGCRSLSLLVPSPESSPPAPTSCGCCHSGRATPQGTSAPTGARAGPRVGWSCLSGAGCISGGADS